jgi:hypothetical protein
MIKKIGALVLAVCMLLVLVVPAQAATITVQSATVEAAFPGSMTFKITAQSGSPITDIRLHYRAEALGFVDVAAEGYAVFQPATSVSTSWKWDLVRVGGLPPGAVIDYWWTLKDSSGATLTTSMSKLTFDDTRFKWQKVTAGKISILWYSGTTAFANDLLTTATDAVTRLQNDTGSFLKEDVRIYIYGSTADMQGGMIFPQEWTGGVAFPPYGTIAIGISASNLTWGKGAIAHELTHQVIHQMTMNPYSDTPTWLDEGLAMYNQGPLDASFVSALQNGISNKTLLTLQTLSSPFSSYSNISYLSYAESNSAVNYLIKTYSKDKMSRLLSAFQKGATYDGALQSVYGFDRAGLTTQWWKSIGYTPKTQ